MDARALLQRALQLHGRGQFIEAAKIYGEILTADPDNVDALNLLAVIMSEAGDQNRAISFASRAVELAPDWFAPLVTLGNAYQFAGRLEEAVDCFRKAIDLEPNGHHARINLASALNALGRHQEAIRVCRELIDAGHGLPEVHNNLGNALSHAGDKEAAEAAFHSALRLRPDFSDARYNLGTLQLNSGNAEAALANLEQAVALNDMKAEKHFNLGNALRAVGRLDEALASYRRALEIDPDYLDAIGNLAAVLHAKGDLGAAEAELRRALMLAPKDAALHWNLALVLIQKGDFAEGWKEYEWRWDNPAFTSPRRDFAQPQWDGGPLEGGTLLLHAEQGYGDSILMMRYVPLVAERCGRVIVEGRPGTERLFATAEGVAETFAMGDDLPPFDAHLPLMSLPRAFDTTLDTVPLDVPYLSVPEGVEADPRIAKAEGLKVGIVWAGSSTHQADEARSMSLDDFSPLFDVPGVSFFSLQVGAAAMGPDDAYPVIDLAPNLTDFADTAAAATALDLMVSVDTAAAHLAGALGRPVWILLAHPASYHWPFEGEDNPWYPTAKLYRQARSGDWGAVMDRLRKDLAALVEKA